MELKIAEEPDRQHWDEIVDRSPNSTLFHRWKWLKLMEKYSTVNLAGFTSKARLYPIFLMEKEKPVGIFPLFYFNHTLIKFCYSPCPRVETLYLGPLFPDIDIMKQEKKQIFLLEMQKEIEKFVKKDLASTFVEIDTVPGFDDSRFFKWGGYRVEPRYTYYIDLTIGTDQIWKGFNRSLRYYIEKAKKEGIIVTDGTKEDALHIYDLLKERKRISSSKEFVGEVFDQFSPDHFKVFIAKAGSERLSGIMAIADKDKVSFWVGAPRYNYKGLSPNELVLWESIRWASEMGYKTFEIEGAEDFSLFPFKRKFNGVIVLYTQMKWHSPLLRPFLCLYRTIKRDNISLLNQ